MTDTEREIEEFKNYIRLCQEAIITNTVTKDKIVARGILETLEEIQQYREIGTVEELKLAIRYIDLAKRYKSIRKAIGTLEEYEDIGTVEECREAVEKVRGLEKYIDQMKWERDVAVEQLKEIGVVFGENMDGVKAAVEKQKPRKPLGGRDIYGNDYKICRECSAIVEDGQWRANFCPDCGNVIDWSEEE